MSILYLYLKECHHNVIQYEFPSAGLSLAAIFSEMEKACCDLHIDDYSVSQNTLDNVIANLTVLCHLCVSALY